MTIGPVTISAADWMAARVSDRMALVAAEPRTSLAQIPEADAVRDAEDGARAQLERRARDRSIVAAQESYKRVAARIKSRLANPPDPRQPIDAASLRMAKGQDAALEGLRQSPRTTASLIAGDQRTEAQQANTQNTRADPLFALVNTAQKKTKIAQESQDAARETAVVARALELKSERGNLVKSDDELAGRTGLWDDLFVQTSHVSAPR